MSYLNYQFLEEYKLLDNLCRDIYGTTPDNKLGVTLYIEDMDKKRNHGSIKIPEWTSDYNHLKFEEYTKRTKRAGTLSQFHFIRYLFSIRY